MANFKVKIILSNNDTAMHDALGFHHGSLSGLEDDDHPHYYLDNATVESRAIKKLERERE